MKNKMLPLLILFAGIFQLTVYSQTGSVELRDAADALVSTHASIGEAYTAIPSPVTQSYKVIITATYTAASETFPITLTQKDGVDQTKTITIRPALGVSMVSIASAQSSLPVILFDGADYVTIDGRAGGTGTTINFFVENTAASGANTTTLNFLNGATNNTLKYIHAKNNLQASAGPRVVLISTAAGNPEGNSGNTIMNCKIEGSRTGIASSGTAANPNQNLTIRDNEIFNFSFAGIWLLSACPTTLIESNLIYQTQGYNSSGVSGINIASVPGQELNIYGNKIYGLTSTSTSATTLRGITCTGSRDAVYNIYNNFIALDANGPSNVSSAYGAQFSGSIPYTLNFNYNSVNVSGTHSGGTSGVVVSACFVKSATNDTVSYTLKNNLFKNTRTGGATGTLHTSSFISALNGTIVMDYNVAYCTGTEGNYHAGWGGTVYNDLLQYQTAATPNETHTIFKEVTFVSASDLHLVPPSDGDIDLAGTPIVGITTDIDFNPRSSTTPYRGADEATELVPVELTSFTSSVNENNVVLTWTTATEKNNYGFEIERSSNKTEWINAGFVKGFGTTVEGKVYSFTDQKLSSGKYSYRLKQIDFDGSIEYHALANEVNVGLPENFAISQNYPNPFNPSTKIDFTIAEASNVVIEIFDVTGGKVAELVNGGFEPGFYTLGIDSGKYRLSSGTYIIRFTAKDGSNNNLFTSIKKMTILK